MLLHWSSTGPELPRGCITVRSSFWDRFKSRDEKTKVHYPFVIDYMLCTERNDDSRFEISNERNRSTIARYYMYSTDDGRMFPARGSTSGTRAERAQRPTVGGKRLAPPASSRRAGDQEPEEEDEEDGK